MVATIWEQVWNLLYIWFSLHNSPLRVINSILLTRKMRHITQYIHIFINSVQRYDQFQNLCFLTTPRSSMQQSCPYKVEIEVKYILNAFFHTHQQSSLLFSETAMLSIQYRVNKLTSKIVHKVFMLKTLNINRHGVQSKWVNKGLIYGVYILFITFSIIIWHNDQKIGI